MNTTLNFIKKHGISLEIRYDERNESYIFRAKKGLAYSEIYLYEYEAKGPGSMIPKALDLLLTRLMQLEQPDKALLPPLVPVTKE